MTVKSFRFKCEPHVFEEGLVEMYFEVEVEGGKKFGYRQIWVVGYPDCVLDDIFEEAKSCFRREMQDDTPNP